MVKKEDKGFYDALLKRDFLDWSFLDGDNGEELAREHYLENYQDLSRKELQKEDMGFYAALRSRGFLDILPESNLRDLSFLDGDNGEALAREHYLENYKGLSRLDLAEEDYEFYIALHRKGLMDIVPKSKWSWLNDVSGIKYWLENYEGLSRKELQKEDMGFYAALQNISNSKQSDWSWLDEEEVQEWARKNWSENYEGRHEKPKHSGFYDTLPKRDLLDNSPNSNDFEDGATPFIYTGGNGDGPTDGPLPDYNLIKKNLDKY